MKIVFLFTACSFSYQLVSRSRVPEISWTTFTQTFDWDYWTLWVSTIIALTFSLTLWAYNFHRDITIESLLSNLSLVLRALCSLDTWSLTDDFLIKHMSYKMLIYAILYFGTLNFYFYNAVLISHLTVSEDLAQVETLEEVNADHDLQLIQFQGFATNSYFSEATNKTPYARELWKRTIEHNEEKAYVPSGDLNAAVSRLKESRNNILLIPETMVTDLSNLAGDIRCQACF